MLHTEFKEIETPLFHKLNDLQSRGVSRTLMLIKERLMRRPQDADIAPLQNDIDNLFNSLPTAKD